LYIEVRKNAFYVKNSSWDKKNKKVENFSLYLGSDYMAAREKLERLFPNNPILLKLEAAKEKYALDLAVSTIKKISNNMENTRAGKELIKLLEKLVKEQNKLNKNKANHKKKVLA
jgi:hypothetical protein